MSAITLFTGCTSSATASRTCGEQGSGSESTARTEVSATNSVSAHFIIFAKNINRISSKSFLLYTISMIFQNRNIFLFEQFKYCSKRHNNTIASLLVNLNCIKKYFKIIIVF